LKEKLRGKEQKGDKGTSGRETSRDGQIAVWRSEPSKQETENAEGQLQPTFDSETTYCLLVDTTYTFGSVANAA